MSRFKSYLQIYVQINLLVYFKIINPKIMYGLFPYIFFFLIMERAVQDKYSVYQINNFTRRHINHIHSANMIINTCMICIKTIK